MAKDPIKVDAKHYKVEFENEHVRVIRIKYKPGEKSVMHGHPKSVIVCLTDCAGRFTYPGGKADDFTMKAGAAMYFDAVEHQPQSTSKKAFELIQIELKD